jgi:hypothetical protein
MLSSHELFGFMSPPLASRIVEHAFETNKELYRTALTAVADARKVRPVFLERQPRTQRHAEMIAMFARPRLELVSANLIRDWLMKKQQPMLVDFLNALNIPHKEGTVDDLPSTMDDQKLRPAVDQLLAKYPPEEVATYLNAFYSMNDLHWENLDAMLKADPRLQFGG